MQCNELKNKIFIIIDLYSLQETTMQ